MEAKKLGDDEPVGCCAKCVACIKCCNLPASAGVKLVAVFSILFGLVYCCLGVWTLIVTTSNNELPLRQQLYYEIWSDKVQQMSSSSSTGSDGDVGQQGAITITTPKRLYPLAASHTYLIVLGAISMSVGFLRTLFSIFLLWNSVEKHSVLPGKVWILITMLGTTTIVSYLIVTLQATSIISDTPWSPLRVLNDKFSFYILITIFRLVCLTDIVLTLYFVTIVVWFIRTR